MSSMRDGIPLAIILTVMNIGAALMYGPQHWQVWAPGILLLAGGALSTLMHVWSLMLGHSTPGLPRPASGEVISYTPEAADV